MLRAASLCLTLAAVLPAQSPLLDEGRLDPAWFGASVALQPSRQTGFQWIRPGLDLQRRTLHLAVWEAPAWPQGRRPAVQDVRLLAQMERVLGPELLRGLRKGPLAASTQAGDVRVIGRAAEAVGGMDDALFASAQIFSLDLKLVDGDTGELMAAFHQTFKGATADLLVQQYGVWCEQLGQVLTPVAPPLQTRPMAPPVPAFDLEGALRRIEGLKRDGLLSEEECQALRKKATARAGAQGS